MLIAAGVATIGPPSYNQGCSQIRLDGTGHLGLHQLVCIDYLLIYNLIGTCTVKYQSYEMRIVCQLEIEPGTSRILTYLNNNSAICST